jgi:hypothetical protein
MKLGSIKVATLLASLVAFVGVTACDQSKADLDKTKGELATVTAERDNLKSQLEQANQETRHFSSRSRTCRRRPPRPLPSRPQPPSPLPGKRRRGRRRSAPSRREDPAANVRPAAASRQEELKANPQARKGPRSLLDRIGIN